MWNYMQLAVQIPEKIPEADYFLKSIDTPAFMNFFRFLLVGGTVIMLAGIYIYYKKDFRQKEENKSVKKEG